MTHDHKTYAAAVYYLMQLGMAEDDAEREANYVRIYLGTAELYAVGFVGPRFVDSKIPEIIDHSIKTGRIYQFEFGGLPFVVIEHKRWKERTK